jgi:transcriptional regulator NrdR family protein
MMVEFSDGSILPFIKEKLLISINKSLGHRTDHVREAVSLTSTVLSKLQTKYKTPLIAKNDIIITVQEVLKNFDNVAAVHYSAYHKINT